MGEHDVSEEQVKLGIDHSWAWFSLHATQRLQMLNFWLVSVSFLTAAFTAAVVNDKPHAAFFVGVAGAALSFCFHRLERRTRRLIIIAERALSRFEIRLAETTGVSELALVSAAETEKEPFSSYAVVIRTMQGFAVLAFSLASCAALGAWVAS